MRKILLFSIGMIAFSIAKSQDSTAFTNKRSELNIGYFNAFNLRSINDFGIGYKFSLCNGAIRMGTTFTYSSSKTTYETRPDNNNIFEDLTIKPRLGYEFHNNYNRFMFYYGFDIVGYKTNSVSKNNLSSSSFLKHETNSMGLGFSPIMGLKFFINKNISISTETSFDFVYKKSSEKYSSSTSVSSNNNSTSKDISAELSPLGIISFNFHF